MNMPLTLPIPLLKEGDRLTREEFHRRYEAMPELNKAELIEGVVYMPSPVSCEFHGQPHLDFDGWIAVYRAFTSGVGAGTNTSVLLDAENEYQPDGILFIEGGQTSLVDGYIAGGPEWAGEISASSVKIDLGPKFKAYRRNGVQEYVVWRVLDRDIDWFRLRDDKYDRLLPDAQGIFRSEVLPGLWLDVPALIQGNLERVHAVLHQGLQSPEHQSFVARLRDGSGKNAK